MAENTENTLKKEWITQSLGSLNLTGEEKIDETLLDEEAVILLNGTNVFNDAIYSYVKISLRNFRRLRDVMVAGQNFSPSDFGEVLAAGQGIPPQHIIDEMRVTYKMVDVPKPAMAQAAMPTGFTQPKFFDDYDA
jgi:hypothetical protein